MANEQWLGLHQDTTRTPPGHHQDTSRTPPGRHQGSSHLATSPNPHSIPMAASDSVVLVLIPAALVLFFVKALWSVRCSSPFKKSSCRWPFNRLSVQSKWSLSSSLLQSLQFAQRLWIMMMAGWLIMEACLCKRCVSTGVSVFQWINNESRSHAEFCRKCVDACGALFFRSDWLSHSY